MDPEVDQEQVQEMPKWVIDGVEYDSLEKAQARLDEKSKWADKMAQERADLDRKHASLQEQLQRMQAERDAQQTQQTDGIDPETINVVRRVMEPELRRRDQLIQQLGGYARGLEGRLNDLSVRSSGIDVNKVRARVRENFADSPADMNMILSSPRLLAEQAKLLEMETHQTDIDRVLDEKRRQKAAITTQSGETGAPRGLRVPTPAELEAMPDAEYAKVMDRANRDPEYAKALLHQ